ncbi:sugar transferase [Salimicrobium halophilum]|uniref:Exopolysaccharide biosynthesis polyprenyl glycosylphosphotransferase n=1 Tax=Salimicrobium halophilum TaxID=86666 RepID=A0A1G8SBZ2_9BACI|nr:sugar transferase [Salimicrobium halophilum]SDJ26721.1 exopolysaccharide biosynthesis polyprenyl glycosylphosphotransferase [Salimicrobium halophilum]
MNYPAVKRLSDVVISGLLLLLLLPFLLVVAVAIKIESKGPVFFKQQRLGLHGQPFTMYKFRSMCVDAEKQGVYESSNDPRVTRVGKIIRRTSVDELPQCFNILKGDMSLIGPRPTLLYHPWSYEEYSEEQKKRFLVRPGITGWAQVNGRKNVLWEERIRYDVAYAEHLSLIFDSKIVFRTLLQVLFMKNNINVKETVDSITSRKEG